MRLKTIKLITALVIIGAALTGFGGVRPALAGSITGTLNITINCATPSIDYSGGATVHWDRDNTGSNSEAISYTVYDSTNVLLGSFTDTRPLGSTAGFSSSYPHASTSAYPVTVRLFSAAGNGLPEATIFSVTGNCGDTFVIGAAAAPALEFVGPPIPAGFVLRTITCDVAVFDTPGGQPVGSNKITAGQSWYVNPKAVTGPSGDSWTEIFVSSETNPFIPTRCVGGYPPNAPVGGQ